MKKMALKFYMFLSLVLLFLILSQYIIIHCCKLKVVSNCLLLQYESRMMSLSFISNVIYIYIYMYFIMGDERRKIREGQILE